MADDSPQKYRKLFGVDVPDNLEPIKIILENTGEGKTIKFDSDDIIDETKQKLGDHVSRITKEAGNSPQITNDSKEVSLRTATGNPKPITDDTDTSATTTFTKELDQKAVSNFREISDSKLLEPNEDLKVNLAKGKTDSKDKITVQKLYNDANLKLGDSKIARIIQERQSENRFYQKNYYLNSEDNPEEDSSNVGNAYGQNKLGVYSPKKWPSVDEKEAVFKIRNLKNLGIQILMESSGEYFIPNDTDNIGQVILSKAATTAPGLARMGLRVRSNRFATAEIANQINPNFNVDSKFPKFKDNLPLSYGSVNNPLVPFNAINSTQAETAAILLATTLSSMLKALAISVDKLGANAINDPIGSAIGAIGSSLKKNSDKTNKTEKEFRRERMGRHRHPNNATNDEEKNHYSLDGILVITENPYDKCVEKGFQIFFDAPTSDSALKNLGQSGLAAADAATGGLLGALGVDTPYDKIKDAPGYYSAVLRFLIRSASSDILGLIGSAATLVGKSDKVENIGAPGPLDVNKNIGLDRDPTNILNSIASLKESKLIKFMNVLANIGDLYLNTDTEIDSDIDYTIDAIVKDLDVNKRSISIVNTPNPAVLIKKNRLSDLVGPTHKGKLAWGSNTLRSLYLLPETTLKANDEYSSEQLESFLQKENNFTQNTNKTSSRTGRISSDLVNEIEAELDSYYMPFYFHDLRTNEIISFHAFIDDIKDTFNADYNETEGFGRLGKVYTYKNTNRSIGFSFKVVATNDVDFNSMWLKINKLLMLLYPQYSAGRTITDGQYGMIQPFSQIITNSPLIRVRIGDLLKTNYSELDLARLFGLGTNKFGRLKTKNDDVREENTSYKNLKEELRNKILSNNFSNFNPGDRFIINTRIPEGTRPRHRSIMKPGKKRMTNINNNLDGLEVRAEYIGPDPISNGTHFIVKVVGNKSNLPSELTLHIGTPAEVGYELWFDDDYYNDNFPDYNTTTKTSTEILPDFKYTEDFFKPENNPIVKAFESTYGQGVAGFIKSLSFDWSDARWETEGLNKRAPMLCKISIEFAPIYDINPGLDVNGEPIGMIYNVGTLLKKMKRNKRDENIKKVYEDNKKAASVRIIPKKIE